MFFFQVRTSCLASVDVTLDENRSMIEPKVVIRFTKETLSFLPRHKGVVICRFGVEGGVIRAGAGFTWGMRFLLHFYFCPAINLIVCQFFSNSLTFYIYSKFGAPGLHQIARDLGRVVVSPV